MSEQVRSVRSHLGACGGEKSLLRLRRFLAKNDVFYQRPKAMFLYGFRGEELIAHLPKRLLSERRGSEATEVLAASPEGA